MDLSFRSSIVLVVDPSTRRGRVVLTTPGEGLGQSVIRFAPAQDGRRWQVDDPWSGDRSYCESLEDAIGEALSSAASAAEDAASKAVAASGGSGQAP